MLKKIILEPYPIQSRLVYKLNFSSESDTPLVETNFEKRSKDANA